MKNLGTALNETRSTREKTNGMALAGVFAIGWGLTDLPEHQLTTVLGMLLLLGTMVFDAAMLFSSLFALGWWERRLTDKRFEEWKAGIPALEEWKAGSPARVAAGIANYEANRASAYDRGYAEGYEHGQHDSVGALTQRSH